MRMLFVAILIVHLFAVFQPAFSQDSTRRAGLTDLKTSIEKVLKDTNTPGMGIAIVTKEGSLWVDGLGKADVAHNMSADENTMFRVASITKMFVALAVLKLQEEGKLSLDDRVRDIVPEIAFENPWEETHPVRIVHLLEHTTGWDDYHLVEQTDRPMTLKDGLDFHPHSRKSRWVPGSRPAYSNSGSAVAAYIVERITGQLYEDYIAEHFFGPLDLTYSTFYNDWKQRRYGATLYDKSNEPLQYRHTIHRPAGAVHSSASDMGKFVRFFLNRGAVDTLRLISEGSINRMEATQSTPGARAGLQTGYGLANFTSLHAGFAYKGHNGGMPGALAELAYLPDHGVGHAFFINSANGFAFSQISELVRNFETGVLSKRLSADLPPLAAFKFEDAYYFPLNPRIQWGYFMDRIIDVYHFEKQDSVLTQSWLLPGAKNIYYPISDSQFRAPESPRIILVKARDPLEGEVLHTDSRVYGPVPAWVVFGQIFIIILWFLMMGLGTILWVFSLARYWAGRSGDGLRVTVYPMMTTLMFFIFGSALIFIPRNYSKLLIQPGPLSMAIMAISVWLILCAIFSVVRILKSRPLMSGRFTFWTMAVLSSLHLAVSMYLLWFGVIPAITWQ